jgi:hypothetical protein
MSGREIQADLGPCTVTRRQRRAAAVHVADRIAAEHPQQTVAELAANPLVAAGLRELLNALDLNKEQP